MRVIIKRYLLVYLFCFLVVLSWAQTGPAGIGNAEGADGNPITLLWLSADSIADVNDGGAVTLWRDLSGNGHDFEQSISDRQPVFTTNGINGKPSLSFDGLGDCLEDIDAANYLNGLEELSIFFVIKSGSSKTDKGMFFTNTTGSEKCLTLRYDSQLQAAGGIQGIQAIISKANIDNSDNIIESSSNIQTTNVQLINMDWVNNQIPNLFIDGTKNALSRPSFQKGAIENVTKAFIGKGRKDFKSPPPQQDSGWKGEIAEVIIYGSSLNEAQRSIVENYLSEKYNIALSTDYYVGATGYDHAIGGIGQLSGEESTSAHSDGLHVTSHYGLDNGDFIMLGHSDVINDDGTTDDVPDGVERRWKRDWQIQKTGDVSATLTFDLSEGIVGGKSISNISEYVLLYRPTTDAPFVEVSIEGKEIASVDRIAFKVENTNLLNGFYTLGTKDESISSLKGEDVTIFYSYTSRNWSDPQAWTLDPSSNKYENPQGMIPNGPLHKVVIASNETITLDINEVHCQKLTINGRLELAESSKCKFDVINGGGRIMLQKDNIPEGNMSPFSNEDRGTVVFTGGSYAMQDALEFYNVEIELNEMNSILTLNNNLTVNGGVQINRGTLQINDETERILEIEINKDLTVETEGKITVGKGVTARRRMLYSAPLDMMFFNMFHQLTIGGDLINKGNIKLCNLTAPKYDGFAHDGAVTLKFIGAKNNKFRCYGYTDVYNLIIDKGENATYELELYADKGEYFRLFGSNKAGRIENDIWLRNDPLVRKALWIYRGTLRLTGNVHIPSLSEGCVGGENGDYTIGEKAKLLIDGHNVEVHTTATGSIPYFDANETIGIDDSGSQSGLSLFGALEITNGYFGTGNSYGIVSWGGSNPTLKIKGGTVEATKLFRTNKGQFSYIQEGGQFIKDGTHDFDMSSPDCVFNMSGGVIEMRSGDMKIGCREENASVTGGTIIFNQNDKNESGFDNKPVLDVSIPLYDLQIKRQNTSGDAIVRLAQDTKVKNDILIGANAMLRPSQHNLNIGGDFIIDKDAAKINNLKGYYTGDYTTTTFDGDDDAVFHIGCNETDGNEYTLKLQYLNINKPAGKRLIITSESFKDIANVSDEDHAVILEVEKECKVLSGILDQAQQSVRIKNEVFVSNEGVLGVYEHNVTNIGAAIVLDSSIGEIKAEDGAIVGNLRISINNPISLSSDLYVKRLDYRRGVIKVKSHNLKIDFINTTGTGSIAYGTNKMFTTKEFASDKGLTLKLKGNSTTEEYQVIFPMGATGKYRPVTMTTKDVDADGGYVTIKPVRGQLLTTNNNGGNLLNYYWKITNDDFTSLPQVKYVFQYDVDDTENINVATYVPGKVLDKAPYTRTAGTIPINAENKVITWADTNDANGFFTLENANYTAGEITRFDGQVAIYYSSGADKEDDARWTSANTWHKDSKNSGIHEVPQEGSVVIIYSDGELANRRKYRVNAKEMTPNLAELLFIHDYDNYPEAQQDNLPYLVFKDNGTYQLGQVRGAGVVKIDSDKDITLNGDFGDFANNADSYYLYAGLGNNIIDDIPNEIPNLKIVGGIKTFDKDITVKGNLVVQGNTTLDITNNIDVKGTLYVGQNEGCQINFAKERDVTLAVNGNVDFTSVIQNVGNRRINVTSGANRLHNFKVGGDIMLGGSNCILDLYNGEGDANVTLTVNDEGISEMSSTGNISAELYRLIVDKGNDVSSSFHVNNAITLLGSTNGIKKALELKKGSLHLNHADIDLALNSGGENFIIPETAALFVEAGRVRAKNLSNIYLDGQLVIDGTGFVDLTGGNNNIVYSATKNAQLKVINGKLHVGGKIRRPLTTTAGSLRFEQLDGEVLIGYDAIDTDQRGVFEILNEGSSLKLTGGIFTICNTKNSPAYPSLYLAPENYFLGENTTINIGNVNTVSNSAFTIYSKNPLENLNINCTDNTSLDVKMYNGDLKINGNLEVSENASLTSCNSDTHKGDLYVSGNINIAGTYEPFYNTTFINGATSQVIDGNFKCYNLVKANDSNLDIHENITVRNDLFLEAGNLIDNNNSIYVKRHYTCNGTHIYGDTGEGIVMNGLATQKLMGSGVIGKLTVNNSAGINLPLNTSLSITNELKLIKGIFNINQNLLTLMQNATITHGVAPFSATNMIQTNISFTDNGVKKILNQGVVNFAYPIGCQGKYTPVDLAITNNTNDNGFIIVKPSDEYHSSVLKPDNALKYYWILIADGITDFSGTIKMKYDENDMHVTAPFTEEDYLTARLLRDNTGDWNKIAGEGVIDEEEHDLVFDFSAVDHNGISGDYTAAVDAALPDQIPTYVSISDGLWKDNNIWSRLDNETNTLMPAGVDVPVGGPKGSLVVIKTKVTIDEHNVSSYTITLDEAGELAIGETIGHRLGTITGTGMLTMASEKIPAGDYSQFVTPEGGTFNFTSLGVAKNYGILGNVTEINNLILSGQGERRMPNNHIEINGNLLVDGAKMINEHDENFCVQGDLELRSGQIDFGTANAMICFCGDKAQEIISGIGFTGVNAFNSFRIDNPMGIKISSDVDIKKSLHLKSGVIFNIYGKDLKVTNADVSSIVDGGSSSYIAGSMIKKVNSGSAFTFPIGDGERYGPLTIKETNTDSQVDWEAEYFNHDATSDGYDIANKGTNVAFVSSNEYWHVKGPVGAKAKINLRWDNLSGVNNNEELQMVHYSAADLWNEIEVATPTVSNGIGYLESTNLQTFNERLGHGNYYTFGNETIPEFFWSGDTNHDWFTASNWRDGVVPGAGTDIVLNDATNDPVISNKDVAQVNDLTIESDALLTMESGAKLTVNGDLKTNNKLVINSSHDNVSSLVVKGNIEDKVQLNFNFEKGRYWYTGIPIKDGTAAIFDVEGNADNFLYHYSKKWLKIKDNSYKFTSPLKGYTVGFVGSDQTIRYEGLLHNNASMYTLNNMDRGIHLVANPFLAFVDLDMARGNSSTWRFNNIEKFVYVRTTVGTERAVVVYDIENPNASHNAASRYIAPFQSFWVNADAANASFGLSKAVTKHVDGKSFLKSKPASAENIIKLTLANAQTYDYAALVLNSDGDVNYGARDAVKVKNSGKVIPALYTRKSDKNCTINTLPNDVDSVELYIDVKQPGEYSLNFINAKEFFGVDQVHLKDHRNNKMIDLLAEKKYVFLSEISSKHQRFTLYLKDATVPTEISEREASVDNDIDIYGQKDHVDIHINDVLYSNDVLVTVYNLSGQIVKKERCAGSKITVSLFDQTNIFIVEVQARAADGSIKQKTSKILTSR